MKLSAAQRKALRSIVDRYDRAVRDELARWGEASARRVADRGVEVLDFGYRTLHALADRGLVSIKTTVSRHKRDRRGAYGRRTGGTKSWEEVGLFVAPTYLGRAEAS